MDTINIIKSTHPNGITEYIESPIITKCLAGTSSYNRMMVHCTNFYTCSNGRLESLVELARIPNYKLNTSNGLIVKVNNPCFYLKLREEFNDLEVPISSQMGLDDYLGVGAFFIAMGAPKTTFIIERTGKYKLASLPSICAELEITNPVNGYTFKTKLSGSLGIHMSIDLLCRSERGTLSIEGLEKEMLSANFTRTDFQEVLSTLDSCLGNDADYWKNLLIMEDSHEYVKELTANFPESVIGSNKIYAPTFRLTDCVYFKDNIYAHAMIKYNRRKIFCDDYGCIEVQVCLNPELDFSDLMEKESAGKSYNSKTLQEFLVKNKDKINYVFRKLSEVAIRYKK